MCECTAFYTGLRCDVPVDVTLTIQPLEKEIFDVGDDVKLVCEVSENSPFESPVWLDPFDSRIEPGKM